MPEQKKIAKFFQCLDELLQPDIIRLSGDNTTDDHSYQTPRSAPTLWTWTVRTARTEPELDDGRLKFPEKTFYFL